MSIRASKGIVRNPRGQRRWAEFVRAAAVREETSLGRVAVEYGEYLATACAKMPEHSPHEAEDGEDGETAAVRRVRTLLICLFLGLLA